MKITKVQVRKVEKENSNVKGYVEVTLDNCFVVKGIRIIEKPEKTIVAMPNKEVNGHNEDGSINTEMKVKVDIAHPINKETREMFNNTILDAYNKADSSIFVAEYND